MNKRKLEAMRSMEADCAIGAGAGFGKYTREVAERRRGARIPLDCDPMGLPYVVDPMVPLYRYYAPTGALMASIQFVKLHGRIHIHPQRLAELVAELANPRPDGIQLDRWSDDGGC